MSTLDTCRCVGSFCRCNGADVLKDGARFRMSVITRDGAISGEKHTFTDSITLSDSDRAYAEMKIRDRDAWQGGSTNPFTADALDAKSPEYRMAASDAAYDAMKDRDRNAWRGA